MNIEDLLMHLSVEDRQAAIDNFYNRERRSSERQTFVYEKLLLEAMAAHDSHGVKVFTRKVQYETDRCSMLASLRRDLMERTTALCFLN